MSPPSPAAALGRFEKRSWPADPGAHGGRRARRAGRYEVFIPDEISAAEFALTGAAVAAVTDAAKALQRLNASPPRIVTLGALAQNLLRSESVASARIEGVHLSHKRLARAAYQAETGHRDPRAAEVLGNVEAMKRAIELGAADGPFTVADLKNIHRTLLRFTSDAEIAGVIRTSQNWIGGNDYNPIGAAYVPPPPELVPPLLEDLCALVNRGDLSPVALAAIAHGQFETIHPFADGNGRAGRALIYTVFRRRGEITHYLPPISMILAAQPKGYVKGLTAYRRGAVSEWVEQFAHATARACVAAEQLAGAIARRQADWLVALGQPRRDAAVRQLVTILPEQPVIDVAAAQRLTGKSHVAIGSALRQLENAGVIKPAERAKVGTRVGVRRATESRRQLRQVPPDLRLGLAPPAAVRPGRAEAVPNPWGRRRAEPRLVMSGACLVDFRPAPSVDRSVCATRPSARGTLRGPRSCI
jgi:Fic family protein